MEGRGRETWRGGGGGSTWHEAAHIAITIRAHEWQQLVYNDRQLCYDLRPYVKCVVKMATKGVFFFWIVATGGPRRQMFVAGLEEPSGD